MTWAELREAATTDVASDDNFTLLCDYLRITPGDDDALVLTCFKAAYDYLKKAVGNVKEDDSTVTLALAAIMQKFYDDRELLSNNAGRSPVIDSILAQLHIDEMMEDF